MCDLVSGLKIGEMILGGVSSFSSMAHQSSQAQAQMAWEQQKYEQDVKFREEQIAYQQYQYEQEMNFRNQQWEHQMEQYQTDLEFRDQQWEWQMEQYEHQLQMEHEQEMANIDYAQRTIEAATDAAEMDLELLDQQEGQAIASASLDDFERRRQALRESAKIRVAQCNGQVKTDTVLSHLPE